MANIDLSQWTESVPVQIAANQEQGFVDIIIGQDDIFMSINHANDLYKKLKEYFGETK
ncbi:putative phage associated protein [Neisseria flavescens]|uniref:Uncharacterized protein n=1 Tax=Neisseria flavescens NRL30031/H210 TaxID=546264 RepID=C0EP83_NEIFL|nr:hypothetical protein [Neisseria flavescens]EEG33207.1 hypothetical protein NEIFLAOT_01773 [Neisseria flavescens NRL30031/H210]SPY04098.1 putative phage associated protein [Neisseria meningitidis]STZ62665.1 putative phage associated protein [Neisseria flavescens]